MYINRTIGKGGMTLGVLYELGIYYSTTQSDIIIQSGADPGFYKGGGGPL